MQQSHIVSWIDVIIDSWADRVPSHGSIPYRPMNRSHIGSWVDPTLSHGLIVYLLIYDTTSSHEPIILSHEPILYCLMDRSYIVSWIDPIYIVSWVDPTSSHGSIPHDHRMRLFDCLTRCWIFVPDYWQGSRYLPREVVCKPFLLPGNGGGWLLVHFGGTFESDSLTRRRLNRLMRRSNIVLWDDLIILCVFFVTMVDSRGLPSLGFNSSENIFGLSSKARQQRWDKEKHAYYGFVTPNSIVSTCNISRQQYNTGTMDVSNTWLETCSLV